MALVIREAEVADLTRRMAEIQHELRIMRDRLSAQGSPLAMIAAVSCAGVEEAFEQAADRLRHAAPVLTTPTQE